MDIKLTDKDEKDVKKIIDCLLHNSLESITEHTYNEKRLAEISKKYNVNSQVLFNLFNKKLI